MTCNLILQKPLRRKNDIARRNKSLILLLITESAGTATETSMNCIIGSMKTT